MPAKWAWFGRLAQLGEHQLDKLGVTGSSPVPPTSETPASPGVFVFWHDDEQWRSAWLVPEVFDYRRSSSIGPATPSLWRCLRARLRSWRSPRFLPGLRPVRRLRPSVRGRGRRTQDRQEASEARCSHACPRVRDTALLAAEAVSAAQFHRCSRSVGNEHHDVVDDHPPGIVAGPNQPQSRSSSRTCSARPRSDPLVLRVYSRTLGQVSALPPWLTCRAFGVRRYPVTAGRLR